MTLRSAVHSFRRAEQGAVEADFHLHMVEHCSVLAGGDGCGVSVFHFIKVTEEASRNSSTDRGEEQAPWKGGRGKSTYSRAAEGLESWINGPKKHTQRRCVSGPGGAGVASNLE